MPLARSPRRRLTAAVTTVLAVTLGASALTAPAGAAPGTGVRNAVGAAGATELDADLIAYPAEGELAGVGLTGFLTRGPSGIATFQPYAGGPVQVYDEAAFLTSTRTADFVVDWAPGKVIQRDLATNTTLVVLTGEAAGDPQYAGAAGDAVYTTVRSETGTGTDTVLLKHTVAAPAGEPVTGLPAGAGGFAIEPATPDHAEITFSQGGARKWGLLDLATGTLTGIRAAVPADRASSATHTAWVEDDDTSLPPRVFVADRATGDVQEVPGIDEAAFAGFHVGLAGNWVLYGQPGGMANSRPGAHYPLTAYRLSPAGTTTSEKLFDHAYQVAPAPDGSLYVRGGIVGQGEGLYRVTDEGGTKPKVVKVATTGRPTEIVATNVTVPPAVLDLDAAANEDGFGFRFALSRRTGDVTLTVRHVRTGQTTTVESGSRDADVRLHWGKTAWAEAPHNGDHTWKLTVRPDNGIGPDAVLQGGFKVVRKTQPHDFNDNGTPDLLTRDTAGRLWRDDLLPDGTREAGKRALLGSGWNVYDRIEAAGNLGGSAVGDLLARDTSGVLWLYTGTGAGNFAGRLRVGGGWQAYDQIASGSDLTGDGRADAVAIDRSGVLWLHPGTGDAKSPFATRKRIGAGWSAYNDLTATGNLAGGPAGDLVARDKAGVLWQYLGKGDGTLAPRTEIGRGWNPYRPLIATGDTDTDGHPDLIGIGKYHLHTPNTLFRGTGNWKTPFRPGTPMNLTRVGGNDTDLVF
ncbi:hypothetical protein [Streptomyces sp. NPDC058486]|uniref:hypothetical protein n=1 Tax=unclassified Streptomyces TaxID=2593676 RepID=UPI0036544456